MKIKLEICLLVIRNLNRLRLDVVKKRQVNLNHVPMVPIITFIGKSSRSNKIKIE